MAHNKRYTLDHFKEDAQRRYPAQFAAVADITAYKFEKISYVGDKQEGLQADMLSVGYYYQKHSGQTVWALANGHSVRYYFGKSREVCALVPDAYRSRIYYHEPFKFMGPQQGCADSGRLVTAARQYEKVVFETVVHFVFLLTGRLTRVYNTANVDMLGNIKFACMSLENNLETKDDAERAVVESFRALEAESESSCGDLMDVSRTAFAPVKHPRPSSSAMMAPNKRARMDSYDAPTGLEPPRQSTPSQLFAAY
jgi:hypothetical protein